MEFNPFITSYLDQRLRDTDGASFDHLNVGGKDTIDTTNATFTLTAVETAGTFARITGTLAAYTSPTLPTFSFRYGTDTGLTDMLTFVDGVTPIHIKAAAEVEDVISFLDTATFSKGTGNALYVTTASQFDGTATFTKATGNALHVSTVSQFDGTSTFADGSSISAAKTTLNITDITGVATFTDTSLFQGDVTIDTGFDLLARSDIFITGNSYHTAGLFSFRDGTVAPGTILGGLSRAADAYTFSVGNQTAPTAFEKTSNMYMYVGDGAKYHRRLTKMTDATTVVVEEYIGSTIVTSFDSTAFTIGDRLYILAPNDISFIGISVDNSNGAIADVDGFTIAPNTDSTNATRLSFFKATADTFATYNLSFDIPTDGAEIYYQTAVRTYANIGVISNKSGLVFTTSSATTPYPHMLLRETGGIDIFDQNIRIIDRDVGAAVFDTTYTFDLAKGNNANVYPGLQVQANNAGVGGPAYTTLPGTTLFIGGEDVSTLRGNRIVFSRNASSPGPSFIVNTGNASFSYKSVVIPIDTLGIFFETDATTATLLSQYQASLFTINVDAIAASGTVSTTTTTGALKVTGGLGVSGDVFSTTLNSNTIAPATASTINFNIGASSITNIGPVDNSGSSNLRGTVNVVSTTASTSTVTGALIVAGGVGIGGAVNIGGTTDVAGDVNLSSVTTSSSAITGALIVAGGVGVSENVNVGGALGITGATTMAGDVNISSATASTSTITGALIVAGGVGIAGATNIGGTTDIGGDVNLSSATASTSTITGALIVAGGVGVSGAMYIGGNMDITGSTSASGDVNISSATASTSTITGALVVSGGVGIGGATNIAGDVNLSSATASTSAITGALIVAGGVGIAGATNIGGDVDISSTTASTSAVTGALIVAGGVGISGATNITGATNIAGDVNLSSATASTSTVTGALIVAGGVGIVGATNIGGDVNLSSATASTSTVTGALIVSGGVGIGGATNIGGDVDISSTTASTSTTTGALVVAGGVGIAGATYVGGVLTLSPGLADAAVTTAIPLGETSFAMTDGVSLKLCAATSIIGAINESLAWLQVMNGSTYESFTVTVTSNGTVITVALNGIVGDEMHLKFSTGTYTLSTNPDVTTTVAAGTDSVPKQHWLYILASSPTVLSSSEVDFPDPEHIPIARILVQSAATVQTDGAIKQQNYTDHAFDTNNMGHLNHLAHWMRHQHATYRSGITIGLTGSGTNSVTIETTSTGAVFQLHKLTYPIIGPTVGKYIVNHWTSGSEYTQITNLHDINKNSEGGGLGGRYFALIIWGVINETGTVSRMMINLPSGSYNTEQKVRNDVRKESNYSIPKEFTNTGFLIRRLVIYRVSGTTTILADGGDINLGGPGDDLRGLYPDTSSGSANSSSALFIDSSFRIENALDASKEFGFDLVNVTTANTRILTVADYDLDLGAPAFQSTLSAATSITTPILYSQVATGGSLTLRANSTDLTGSVLMTGTTGSTSVATGTLVVSGGVGVGEKLYVNSGLTVVTGGVTISGGDLTVGGSAIGTWTTSNPSAGTGMASLSTAVGRYSLINNHLTYLYDIGFTCNATGSTITVTVATGFTTGASLACVNMSMIRNTTTSSLIPGYVSIGASDASPQTLTFTGTFVSGDVYRIEGQLMVEIA